MGLESTCHHLAQIIDLSLQRERNLVLGSIVRPVLAKKFFDFSCERLRLRTQRGDVARQRVAQLRDVAGGLGACLPELATEGIQAVVKAHAQQRSALLQQLFHQVFDVDGILRPLRALLLQLAVQRRALPLQQPADAPRGYAVAPDPR